MFISRGSPGITVGKHSLGFIELFPVFVVIFRLGRLGNTVVEHLEISDIFQTMEEKY